MEQIETMKWVFLFVYLGVNGIYDLRKKQVYFKLGIFCIVLGSIWQLCVVKKSAIEFMLSLLVGVICVAVAFISKGGIGYGDSLILFVTGIFLGLEKNLLLCMISILVAGIWALILLLIFHKGKKYEIPFVPFLFFGLFFVRCLSC